MADKELGSLGPHGLEPELEQSNLLRATLAKLERDGAVLVQFKAGGDGALLRCKREVWAVEKIPAKRITFMVRRFYIAEVRGSAFGQLGWTEYDVTYDGVMLNR